MTTSMWDALTPGIWRVLLPNAMRRLLLERLRFIAKRLPKGKTIEDLLDEREVSPLPAPLNDPEVARDHGWIEGVADGFDLTFLELMDRAALRRRTAIEVLSCLSNMADNALLSRISIDPNICFGKPCIRGHRIWVSLVLDLLASGSTVDEVLESYPGIEEADVLACIAYGAEMSRERYVEIPTKRSA